MPTHWVRSGTYLFWWNSLVVEDYNDFRNLISQETQKSWMHFRQLLRAHLLQKYPEQMCSRAQWLAHRCDYSKNPIQRICGNPIVPKQNWILVKSFKYFFYRISFVILTDNQLGGIDDKFQPSFFPSIDDRLGMCCEMNWWSNAIAVAPYRRIDLIYSEPWLDYPQTSDTWKQVNVASNSPHISTSLIITMTA